MKNIEQAYQQALDYIYSFIDYSLTRNLRYSAEKFNLERMARFMELMGNPQDDYKIIHVAGTKGKGSTCAMLTSILTTAGYKTGFYSSPHMIEFTERIKIGDRQISKSRLADCVECVKPFVAKVEKLTTFEIITGIAMKYFSDEKVDFAVLEVGMGGRLDATNVVKPMISVITSISHDHTKVLGSTLAKIAKEKAGIIKPYVPVVIAKQKKAAEEMILSVALEKQAKIIDIRQELKIKKMRFSLDGQYFSIKPSKEGIYSKKDIDERLWETEFFMPLLGDHQLNNAATAIACVLELSNYGYRISIDDMIKGFGQIDWPGRFEIISRQPLIIIDGAHNRDSIRKFKATIDLYLPGKKKILIFGASEDKEVKLMLSILQPSIDRLIITKAKHPRALEVEDIEKIARDLGFNYDLTGNVEESLEIALKKCESDSVILAAGSIFIAGAVKEIWSSHMEGDKW